MRPMVSALACAVLCSAATAQPKLIITGIADDLAPAGDGVSGKVAVGLTGANANYSVVPIVWARGGGYTIIPGAVVANHGEGKVSCASGLSALSMLAPNSSNWGDLNCFAGYCFGSMAGCTPGAPLPTPSPCQMPGITQRWTLASGWSNAGSFTRMLDAATGRYFGGTRCDQTISNPNDISGNGRYIVGGAYWAPLTTASGGPGFGLCGSYLAFRYDSLTGAFEQLPTSSTTTRADRVNNDGSVISGYDLDASQSLRRTAVWRNGVEYIIDPYLGAKDSAGISGPGNIVASGASTEFVAATFPGVTGVRLVRWTWNGSGWTPENLGRPADYLDPGSGVPIAFSDLWVTGVSDDGNTIIGTAQYGAPPPTLGGLRRPFIWRPTINEGVPIDLENYINSLGTPIFTGGFALNGVVGLSGDGNQVLISIFDGRNTCPPGFNAPRSHNTFNGGVLFVSGAAVPCDAPRIGVGPEDWNDASGLSYGVSLNVVASGTWPLTYQWQREDPASPGVWVDLTESCKGFSTTIDWDYEGANKNQLRIGSGAGYAARAGRYRVMISNSCGTVVSPPATVSFTPGACCFPGGTCELGFFYSCSEGANGGSFQGVGTTCTPTICAERACCISESCALVDPLTCAANAGTAGAEGSTCLPDPCSLSAGACCSGSTCAAVTAAECTGVNTTFAGTGTVCNAFGANNASPCCLADYNHVGGVTVQDIFDFLSGYFTQSPQADINGVGGVTVQDIFDYLSVYFAGCA
jgi:hypothetical protein